MDAIDIGSILNLFQDGEFTIISMLLLQLIIKIFAILIIAKIVLKFSGMLVERILTIKKDDKMYLDEKKANTLIPLLKSVLKYLIYFIAAVSILAILGIPTGSILATAGIGGLAIGFGAQNLVKDVITGFFIIFENQFAVGDYITAAGKDGVVEEMGLRVTKLRDFSGDFHIIPNGEIGQVTNRTRGNMRAMVDVGIAYEENIDNALNVLEGICQKLGNEMESIVEGPTVLGVVDLGDSDVVIRIIAKTLPMEQWMVERVMKKTIKDTFDEKGIEIPYPRRVLYSRSEENE